MPYRPGRHARLLRNGNLAYNGVHPDAPRLFPLWQKYRGGVMMEVDPQGNVVREHRDPLAHHDQHHLGDGELLYTTVEELDPEQGECVLGGIPGSEAPNGKIYADCMYRAWSDYQGFRANYGFIRHQTCFSVRRTSMVLEVDRPS